MTFDFLFVYSHLYTNPPTLPFRTTIVSDLIRFDFRRRVTPTESSIYLVSGLPSSPLSSLYPPVIAPQNPSN